VADPLIIPYFFFTGKILVRWSLKQVQKDNGLIRKENNSWYKVYQLSDYVYAY
jgi:hypothetical protein